MSLPSEPLTVFQLWHLHRAAFALQQLPLYTLGYTHHKLYPHKLFRDSIRAKKDTICEDTMYIGELIKLPNLPWAHYSLWLIVRSRRQRESLRHNAPLIFPGQVKTNKLPANHINCNMLFH